MVYKRGAICLANFNPSKGSEPGKIRPCLIMQSDLLNAAGHPTTTVIPLTTQLIDDAEPLRFRIHARDKLDSDSDIMLDQTRTIDNRWFMGGILTTLTESELIAVEESWKIVLGLGG
ncbi:MAG TPA: type II toxin-antitoxin system PemK/MazF family toxin [Gammaproteobacteria bacterium]|nr:type II toxin-antitoxin system PemK/MazF family toxin [Gammaproteobacteria bacterium]